MSGETVTYSLEAVLTRIEGKIDKIDDRLTKLEIGQTEIKGEIKALDERLSVEIIGVKGEIKALDERLSVEIIGVKGEIKALDERGSVEMRGLTERIKYQEFTNRGILIALVVAILGGAAKVLGFVGNP
ncbi:hypothetical protein V0288_01485 [Pannus brasiliensis CCIBt3594]|uniref:Uncharacterized protein n=1 Tax=Pannus brasiliensis CCIBt3594 TaxID=1427578 RepID=A0AAW9QTB0_9CHRO